MLHYRCKAAALLVQGCCTFGIPMLDYRYTYAGLSVHLCWTIGTPMLDLRYQDAALLWYRFFNLFTGYVFWLIPIYLTIIYYRKLTSKQVDEETRKFDLSPCSY